LSQEPLVLGPKDQGLRTTGLLQSHVLVEPALSVAEGVPMAEHWVTS